MGESAGLTLRQYGLRGRLAGSWPRAALMAACTSRAAASMLRFRSNCSVMLVEPSVLDDVISLMPAMRPNWRSSGVATEDAMVSGLAPGRTVDTEMDGKSTCGSGAPGRKLYATGAGHSQSDGEQRGRDGPVDEWRGDAHGITDATMLSRASGNFPEPNGSGERSAMRLYFNSLRYLAVSSLRSFSISAAMLSTIARTICSPFRASRTWDRHRFPTPNKLRGRLPLRVSPPPAPVIILHGFLHIDRLPAR